MGWEHALCPSPDTDQQGTARDRGPSISVRSEPVRDSRSSLPVEANGEVLSPESRGASCCMTQSVAESQPPVASPVMGRA